MDRPGEKLKHARERLKLTFRQVEAASQEIAERRGSDEFAVALSRLADIENKGTIPTIFRLYTLCAIYRLEYKEVLRWYGVPLDELLPESLRVPLAETHAVQSAAGGPVSLPELVSWEIDLQKTTFLSHLARNWGTLPASFLSTINLRHHRYAFIGLSDWSMYPLLAPGSLVVIDERSRKIANGGWTSEHERPIYFLEHRDCYVCGWCALTDGRLLVQPHPASLQPPRSFDLAEIDIIGQVTGVAMTLGCGRARHAVPETQHGTRPRA